MLPESYNAQDRTRQPSPPPQRIFLGFLRGPAAGLFWRPPNTLVPKSTPSALGEVALCQQAERRCEGSHSGQGGGWAGPCCSLVMRIPHSCCSPRVPSLSFPPVFPQPDHSQGLEGTQGGGRQRRPRGQRPGLHLPPGPWACSQGPCTACPGRKSGWRLPGAGLGPMLSHQEQDGPRHRPATASRRARAD